MAVTAFQSLQDVLLRGIHSNLPTLATKLLAKSVITPETSENACNKHNGSRERARYLLGSVQSRIKIAPADFIKVVGVLESEPTLTALANQLVYSYHCSYIGMHVPSAHWYLRAWGQVHQNCLYVDVH